MAQSKKKHSLFKDVLLVIFCVALLGAVLWLLSYTTFFEIENINVVGSSHYSADQILEACTIKKNTPLRAANVQKAQDVLNEQFSDLDSITVEKKYPDTIVITVKSVAENYDFVCNKNVYIASESLKLIEIRKKYTEGILKVNLPIDDTVTPGQRITITDAKSEKVFNSTVDMIKSGQLSSITHIFRFNDGFFGIVYDSRIIIKTDGYDNFQERMSYAYSVCTSKDIEPNFIGYFDVSGYTAENPEGRARIYDINSVLKEYFNVAQPKSESSNSSSNTSSKTASGTTESSKAASSSVASAASSSPSSKVQ